MSGEAIKPGTRLPWQYRDDYTTEGFVTIIGNVDGEYIDGQASCTYDVVCRCEDEFGERLPNVAQNVRYIVHACNEYPALKAKADELADELANVLIAFMSYHDVPGPVDAPLAALLREGFKALAAYRESGQ